MAALTFLGDFTHGRELEGSGVGGRGQKEGMESSLWSAAHERVLSSVWERLSHKRPPHLHSGLAQKQQDAGGKTALEQK